MLGWLKDRISIRPNSVASLEFYLSSNSVCFDCGCLIIGTSKVCTGVRKPSAILNQILTHKEIWLGLFIGTAVELGEGNWRNRSFLWSGSGWSSTNSLVIRCVISYIILPNIFSCICWLCHCWNIIFATVLQKNIISNLSTGSCIHVNALEV